jgi:polyisoprenoid-binding protein YceI
MESTDTTNELPGLSGTWTLDPRKTTVSLRTKALWILPVTGSAQALSGEAHVGPDSAVRGTLVIDAASLDTKNARRDQHLRSSDFLDALNHPVIVFTADGGRPITADAVEIEGELMLHGQIHPLALQAEVAGSGDSVTVSAEVVIDRIKWGMPWGAKLGVGRSSVVAVSAHFDRHQPDLTA